MMKIEGQSAQGKPAHPIKEPKPPSGEKKTIGQVFEKSIGEKKRPQNCTMMGHFHAGAANVTKKSMEETPSSIALDALLGRDPALNAFDYFWQGYADHVVECKSGKEKGQ